MKCWRRSWRPIHHWRIIFSSYANVGNCLDRSCSEAGKNCKNVYSQCTSDKKWVVYFTCRLCRGEVDELGPTNHFKVKYLFVCYRKWKTCNVTVSNTNRVKFLSRDLPNSWNVLTSLNLNGFHIENVTLTVFCYCWETSLNDDSSENKASKTMEISWLLNLHV